MSLTRQQLRATGRATLMIGAKFALPGLTRPERRKRVREREKREWKMRDRNRIDELKRMTETASELLKAL